MGVICNECSECAVQCDRRNEPPHAKWCGHCERVLYDTAKTVEMNATGIWEDESCPFCGGAFLDLYCLGEVEQARGEHYDQLEHGARIAPRQK